MKKMILQISVGFLAVTLLAGGLQAAALPTEQDGWDNPNAGDTTAAEFILSGRATLQSLDLAIQGGKSIYDTTKLRAAMQSTEVVSEKQTFRGSEETDALNYPDKHLIRVSRSRWTELRKSVNTKDRLTLVLHEYLDISGVDDSQNKVSGWLIQMVPINNYSPSIWWNPVNPMNYVTATLEDAPSGCSFDAGKFNIKSSAETVVLEPTGNCGDSYRKIQIVKTAGVTPASSNIHGLFHKYDFTVFDRAGKVQGQMGLIPKFGACMVPDSPSCRTDMFSTGGVDLVLWFLKD